jgi:hypothetical protein
VDELLQLDNSTGMQCLASWLSAPIEFHGANEEQIEDEHQADEPDDEEDDEREEEQADEQAGGYYGYD